MVTSECPFEVMNGQNSAIDLHCFGLNPTLCSLDNQLTAHKLILISFRIVGFLRACRSDRSDKSGGKAVLAAALQSHFRFKLITLGSPGEI